MIADLIVTREDFESIENYRTATSSTLRWELIFTLPAWLKTWWRNFGTGAELYLKAVKQGDQVIGIAPLQIRDGKASFVGNPDICDYQDFITAPNREKEFFNAILEDLRQNGIKTLELEPLRPDSSSIKHLVPLAQERNFSISSYQSDVSLDLDLPANWEDYLTGLDGKQRHELKRKIRNLQRSGTVDYRVIEDSRAISEFTDLFLQMFPDYRRDKAEFMTAEMQNFFRSMSLAMAEIGILRFGVLGLENKSVAMIMYFDYSGNMYLYNSAYDPEFRSLSVGVINKARCIQDGIEKRKKKFDFLKGSEQYKYYLGGKEIPLYNYVITIH